MKLAAPLLIAVLAAALVAGCGSSSDEGTQGSEATAPETTAPQPLGEAGTRQPPSSASADEAPAGASARPCDTYAIDAEGLRVTGLSCKQGRQLMFAWQRAEGCVLIGDASRGACSVRSYRCLATKTARGVSVSCAQPGRSLAFLAKRG
jgi:hypothetical protein